MPAPTLSPADRVKAALDKNPTDTYVKVSAPDLKALCGAKPDLPFVAGGLSAHAADHATRPHPSGAVTIQIPREWAEQLCQ